MLECPPGVSSHKREDTGWTAKEWLNLPMGGISISQAEMYCKWLENYYNQIANAHDRPCFYEIRLPSESELMSALQTKGVLTAKGINRQSGYRFAAFIHSSLARVA